MAQTSVVRGVHTKTYTDEGGDTCIEYRGTCVVKFSSTHIMLDTGGWKSATTKTRMTQAFNQFGLQVWVFQKNFEWFVAISPPDATNNYYPKDATEYPFTENRFTIDRRTRKPVPFDSYRPNK